MSTFIFGLVSLGAIAFIEKASILNLGGLDKRVSIVACLGVYLLASLWEHQVTKIVLSPYLVSSPCHVPCFSTPFAIILMLTSNRMKSSIFPKLKHIVEATG
jgi:hypothetical protein